MTTLDEIKARADAAQGAWEEFQQGIETTRFALEEANNSAEDVPNLIAALRAVEAVHTRVGLYEMEDSCPNTDEKHREEHHRECTNDAGEHYCDQLPAGAICETCSDDYGNLVDWPCPTIQAIREALDG